MGKEPMVSRNVRFPEKLWDDGKAAADSEGRDWSEVLRSLAADYVRKTNRRNAR